MFWQRRTLTGRPLQVVALGIAASLLLAPHVYAYDLIMAVVPLIVIAQRDLAAALAAAVLLNAAHLVDTFFIISGPHVAALALCVIVALVILRPSDGAAHPVGRPARAQLSVARPTTTGA
jgi:hypothetical protein